MRSQAAFTMQNSNYYILIVWLALLCSCSSNKKLGTGTFENEIFTIEGVSGCKESHSGDAIDSQIGQIQCKEISFAYDYGKYGARGPKTPEEDFRAAFDNYHYTKFFELTYIDIKVQPIFKDSVEIVKLHKATDIDESTMFDCTTCNAVAELTFKGKTFFYPTTVNGEQLEANEANINFTFRPDQTTKLYDTDDNKLSAVVAPRPFRRHRDYLAISVTNSSYSKAKQAEILASIVLLDKK